MLNLNQLRVFYEAARLMNYTKAARKLSVSQPAVTAQIRSFEQHCGMKLFKQRGRSKHLTEAGKTLFEYAARVFSQEREIETAIEELRELKRGVLRVGTAKTYARYFMPLLVTRFHEAYPQVRIFLDEGSSRDMTLSLVEFRNELAVIARAEEHPDVCFVPFSQEEIVAIAAADHPLAGKRALGIRDLAGEPIIMKEAGSGTRKLVNQLFAQSRTVPTVLMETSNTEFIKQLVQRGEGVSFLVREAVALELKEGKLAALALGGRKMQLDVSIAYLRGQHLSPPAQAFLELLGRVTPLNRSPQGIGALMAGILAQRR